jgi:sugar lactone lactonase YvrE
MRRNEANWTRKTGAGGRVQTILMGLLLILAGIAHEASAQDLSYVPVIGTYAGGVTTKCATATDVFGDGCPATQAILANPWSTTSDAQGNLYFSDLAHNLVRRIDAATGIITTVAGGTKVCAAPTDTVGDGCPATQATLNAPQGVRLDSFGNLYISDGGNNRVRVVNLTTNIINTAAGTGTTASVPPSNSAPNVATSTNIGNPYGLAFDAMGNLYIDTGAESAILMMQAASNGQVMPSTSLIYTIAGNGTRAHTGDGGPGPSATLYQNRGVFIGPDGSVYIGDFNNNDVRKVTSPFASGTFNPATTTITTIAGTPAQKGYSGDGGQATSAVIDAPEDLFLDNVNNLYLVGYATAIADGGDYIREVNPAGIISTFTGIGTREVTAEMTGDGGPAVLAGIEGPQGGNYDRFGNMFIGSCPNCNIIRRISTNNDFLQNQAVGATSSAQNVVVQANVATNLNAAAILPTAAGEFVLGGVTGCAVGGSLAQSAYCTLPVSFQPAYPGLRTAGLVVTDASSKTSTLGLWGTGVAPLPIFGSSTIATVAGTGAAGSAGNGAAANAAQLNAPGAGVVDSAGNIFFADTENNEIRRVDAKTGTISVVAGSGSSGYSGDNGAATAAQLNAPGNVALDAAGNFYIADSGNNVVRFVSIDSGVISTIAGTGTATYLGDGGLASAAGLNHPGGLLVDAGGNIYVADSGNNVVRKFAKGGPIVTIVGTGKAGFAGDGGPGFLAQLNGPTSLAFDGNWNLYIADTGNSVVREFSYVGLMSTVAGTAGSTGNAGDGGLATAATLTSPSSIAVDAGGEVYVASGTKVRLVNTAGVISTFAGTGATGAYSGEGGAADAAVLGSSNLSVMLDSASNLYIASLSENRLFEVSSSVARSLDFGVTAAGTSGTPVSTSFLNAGNSPLTLTGLTVSSNFTLDATVANACTSTTVLAPGTGCALNIAFTPLATVQGSVTGSIVLTDNSLNTANSTQTISLTGSTQVVAATTTTLTISPVSPVYGASATATATITNGTSPAGNVTFSLNGTSIGTVPVASGAASLMLPAFSAGTQTLTAVYSGDTDNKSSNGTLNFTVAPASLTVTAGNATKAQGDPNPTFTYMITDFVNGDTAATAVTGAPGLTTTATAASVQGTYPITAALGTLTSANYTFTFVNATLTVGPPPPVDFTIAATPTTVMVTDGQLATVTVSLTSLHNYVGNAQLSCTGLPKNVVCGFTPQALTGTPSATNATTSTTLTIATDRLEHITSNRMPARPFRDIGLPTLAMLFLFLGRRRRFKHLVKLAMLLVIAGGLSSCANSLGKDVATPGTYTITVQATDGSLTRTAPITLTIN